MAVGVHVAVAAASVSAAVAAAVAAAAAVVNSSTKHAESLALLARLSWRWLPGQLQCLGIISRAHDR